MRRTTNDEKARADRLQAEVEKFVVIVSKQAMEIERLRSALRKLEAKSRCPDCGSAPFDETIVGRLQAEVERLKERQPDWSPGDVIAAYADGSIVLDDGKTTWNPDRACKWLTAQLAEQRAELERLNGQLEMRKLEYDALLEEVVPWRDQRTVTDGLREALRDTRDAMKLAIVLSERPVTTRVWLEVSDADIDAYIEQIRTLKAKGGER